MSDTKKLRNRIIETVYKAKEGHIASALSILDIIYVLYDKILNIPDPKSQSRDRFILSKGHGSLALYAVLEDKNFFPKEQLDNYCKFASDLGGHPYPKLPGIETATGSLGHGFPFAIGVALALKLLRNPARVFVMVGDQECNEGTIWESAMLAVQHELNNITLIVDNNRSSKRSLNMFNLVGKFQSFGWEAGFIDGHDHNAIEKTLEKGHDMPFVVVADTIKGYGCQTMQDNPNEWHHKIPTEEEYNKLIS